jgi:DNA-directed RNA polymerase subunit F
MKVKTSSVVSVSEAKEILSKRQEDGELGYEQAQALEHAEKFCKEKPDKCKKIVEALAKHEKVSEELAVKIADIGPSDPATLKAILAKDRIELSDEEAAAILKDMA